MRRLFILSLLFIVTIIPLKAQIALSAEGLVAYPLYFNKEEIGITSNNLQTGFRMGAYYYARAYSETGFVVGLRFTHHFTTTDSSTIQATGRNYNDIFLNGSAKTVFNSF